MKTLQEKIDALIREEIKIVTYDPEWSIMFETEKMHLRDSLPNEIVRRIEHFGSTAVPGMAAKPIIDMLIEVSGLEETKRVIVPILERQGYEYFWRPTVGDDGPPFYAWFIKRDRRGERTHHLHMVEGHFEHWDRLLFRDYLRDYPSVAKEYERVKIAASLANPHDRRTYANDKSDFILRITAAAKKYYRGGPSAA